MPPKEKKERVTNYKTWEAQSRLLCALVASLGTTRFDYAKIARHLGAAVTESTVEHRMRAVRVQAEGVKELVARGMDPAQFDIPLVKTKGDIQKFFGASTPDGIGFQFRAIKRGAEVLANAVANGEDPVEAYSGFLGKGGAAASVPATPSTRTPNSTKRARATSTKAAGPKSGGTPANKRRKSAKVEPEADFEDDDEGSPEVDYSELDTTPTKLKPKVKTIRRKNPELLPHSSWAKPVDKKAAPRPRPVPIAPAPARPTVPTGPPTVSYTLAPIAGVNSYVPPNGYTDPATGFGFGLNVRSASASTVNSPATGMTTMRRGSAFSNGSFTAASSPDTPTLPYSEQPTPANGGSMNMNMATIDPAMTNTGPNPNPITNMPMTMPMTAAPNMNMSPTFHNTNMAMPGFTNATFATSPAVSANSPHTTTSSNTVASGAVAENTTASSFQIQSSPEEFQPLTVFNVPVPGTSGRVGVDLGNGNGSGNGRPAPVEIDTSEAAFATQVDFGGFEGDEGWDDAGDC